MSKPLAAEQIRLNLVDILQTAADPSAGGGVAAAIGSFYLRSTTGQIWQKTGAAATAWSQWKQSFNWYVVRDYGAAGDGTTDDTAAFAAAISDANAAGGGVVYVPPGTYALTQLSLNATANVQIVGAGDGSVLKWKWNAATAAGSMITVIGGATRLKFTNLTFNGSALTNPNAGRDNHLLRIGNGATGASRIDVLQCKFTGMVAASGDGVHAVGAAGNLVTQLRIGDCVFDGCSQYGVGVEQGVQYFWTVQSSFTNNETDIAFVSTANVNSDSITILGNQIVHTGSVRHALRFEGDATGLITKLIVAENAILNGFVTVQNVQYMTAHGNINTSGAYASSDGVWAITKAVTDLAFVGNLIDRASGASSGYCITVLKSTTSPTGIRIGQNMLLNEISGAGFVQVVDCTLWSFGANVCRNTNSGGGSTTYAIDVQAVTVDITDALVGPSNSITAAAGSYAGGVHLLCNGANVTNISVSGNQMNQIDYGLTMEIAGGGGTFNGILLFGGNNANGSVGAINRIGNSTPVRIGWNAGTLGPNLWNGSGTPEAVVTARVGSMYLNDTGGSATAVYYKETGTGNTGWVGIGGSIIPFGADSLGLGAARTYMGTGYIAATSAVEIQQNLTRAATIRNLRVQVATAGTGAATVSFFVRKNGVDSAITTTISNTATGAATDLTHSFTVVAGDLLSIAVDFSAGVAVGQAQVTASLEMI